LLKIKHIPGSDLPNCEGSANEALVKLARSKMDQPALNRAAARDVGVGAYDARVSL
jgi:hypothetical protein